MPNSPSMSDPRRPVVERKRSSRRSAAIVSLGILAIVVMLGLIAAGYWRYVNDVPPFTPPVVRMPVPNGYARAEDLVSQLSASRRPPGPRTWPSGTPRELEAQLAPLRPALDAMRATLRLEWRAPLQLHLKDLLGVQPNFAGLRECTRCFAAESNLARDRGEYAVAMERSLDGMELGSKVANGSMIPWLVGEACHAIGFAGAERLVPSLPAGAVPAALPRVRRLRKAWPGMAEMLESERVMSLSHQTEVYQDLQRQSLRGQIGSLYESDATVWKAIQKAWTPRRVALSNIDRCYREWIAESKKPVRQRTMPPVHGDPLSLFLVTTEADVVSAVWDREARRETQLTLLEVALAVRIHYLQHRAYPRQLGDIDRKWLPSVPNDCWGQPVAYRLKDGQPLIYSLGPDGKDDGGQAADPLQLTPQTRGDLVFGQLSRRTQSGTNGGSAGKPK